MATGRLPDPNSSPLTAKGDLYTYSTVPAKLAVGSNGETLVADSSATTGLRWQGNYSAGKNKIINGDFGIWQRGTSITVPIANNSYSGADRFCFSRNGTSSVVTCSRQAFTPGTAPVAGYEGNYFLRLNQTTAGSGGSYNEIQYKIEDVTTFAGQTVTFSFWAKADSSRTLPQVVLIQNFGSGGSSQVNTNIMTNLSLTTSWQRFTATVTLPSISGKTIGTSSFLEIDMQLFMNTTFTFDTWGWQLEAGSVATAFQTATGTLQGELAACQRYYSKSARTATAPADGNTYSTDCIYQMQSTNSTTVLLTSFFSFPMNMRVAPTMTFYRSDLSATNGKWGYYSGSWNAGTTTVTSVLTDKGFAVEMGGTYTANNAYSIAGGWAASAEL